MSEIFESIKDFQALTDEQINLINIFNQKIVDIKKFIETHMKESSERFGANQAIDTCLMYFYKELFS
jgi:hypothetical protein